MCTMGPILTRSVRPWLRFTQGPSFEDYRSQGLGVCGHTVPWRNVALDTAGFLARTGSAMTGVEDPYEIQHAKRWFSCDEDARSASSRTQNPRAHPYHFLRTTGIFVYSHIALSDTNRRSRQKPMRALRRMVSARIQIEWGARKTDRGNEPCATAHRTQADHVRSLAISRAAVSAQCLRRCSPLLLA